jgi:flagellar L-ring protein FlgH
MRGHRSFRSVLMIGVVSTLLIGCGQGVMSRRSAMNPLPVPSIPPGQEEGSIWSAKAPLSIYADVKARNVGDIVTISIVESAKASKNATTKTERTSGLEANWTGVFDNFAKQYKVGGLAIPADNKVAFANNFDGKGETTRTSYMSAFITAHVIEVLANGNMVIQGAREVQVNGENQFIYIRGIIRPEDISTANVILSTFVADAVIELSGEGPVSDKQRPGWLARILDWAWPF